MLSFSSSSSSAGTYHFSMMNAANFLDVVAIHERIADLESRDISNPIVLYVPSKGGFESLRDSVPCRRPIKNRKREARNFQSVGQAYDGLRTESLCLS